MWVCVECVGVWVLYCVLCVVCVLCVLCMCISVCMCVCILTSKLVVDLPKCGILLLQIQPHV